MKLFIIIIWKNISLVFRMLEDEEENVQQLEILVARFYRPFKMAASSKKSVFQLNYY